MKKYNLIFVLIDGARNDRVSKFNKLNKILNDGTYFSQMITASPYTIASMNSIFTGMYGSKNGVNAYNNTFNLRDDCITLTEYLKNNGYSTIGDTVNKRVLPNRGFDQLTEHKELEDDIKEKHLNLLRDLNSRDEQSNPFFLYLHYSGMHSSMVEDVFSKYSDFDQEYFDNIKTNSKNYDGYFEKSVEYIDSLYSYINQSKLKDNSIIVFMSDHGMSTGEKYGERAYGVFTYDYSIRSFAVMIQPDFFPKNKKIEELTQTIDVMPTLLDILEINSDSSKLSMQGESLTKLIKKRSSLLSFLRRKKERIAYCETGGLYGPWPSPLEPNVKCVRTNNWKLIHNITPNTWELYNILEDPSENNNIINSNSEGFYKLKLELEKIVDDCQNK